MDHPPSTPMPDTPDMPDTSGPQASAGPGTLASPCVGVCRLDRAEQECLGCRRTLAEIGAWRDLDDRARQRVLDAAAVRRAARR